MELVGNGARFCRCRVAKIRATRLDKIPPRFAAFYLTTLEPNLSAHPMQAEIVPQLKRNPEGSYLLSGRFGCGKSLMMWMLYRYAIKQTSQKVVCLTLTELLNQYKALFQGNEELTIPDLNASELKQTDLKYSIFFDDIDKARPTEYAAEQFFEIVNAIYEYKHQLVVTTNLPVAQLINHFDRADERFGGAIVRRLVDGAKVYEMF